MSLKQSFLKQYIVTECGKSRTKVVGLFGVIPKGDVSDNVTGRYRYTDRQNFPFSPDGSISEVISKEKRTLVWSCLNSLTSTNFLFIV